MKKIILATTALVGLAAFAQPTLAADTPVGKDVSVLVVRKGTEETKQATDAPN